MKFNHFLWPYIGRFMLAAFFIWMALYKAFYWLDVESQMIADVCNWHLLTSKVSWLENIAESLLPLVPLLHGAAVALLLCGSLMLILSWHVRLGAVLLFVYTLFDTAFTHYFWMLEGIGRQMELTMFMQNISILGGLVLILAAKKEEKKVGRKQRLAPIPILSEREDGK